MARTGRVYVLRDPDGNMVYTGSTEDPYRLTRHRNQCKTDADLLANAGAVNFTSAATVQ